MIDSSNEWVVGPVFAEIPMASPVRRLFVRDDRLFAEIDDGSEYEIPAGPADE